MQGIKYSLLQSLHFLKQFNCWLLRADELDISENSRQLQLDGNHFLSHKFSTISLFFHNLFFFDCLPSFDFSQQNISLDFTFFLPLGSSFCFLFLLLLLYVVHWPHEGGERVPQMRPLGNLAK